MKKIAILTSLYRFKNNWKGDLALLKKLKKKNIKGEIINWDNKEYDFSKVDLAIVRSCWDYDQRLEEFIKALAKISKATKLINSLKIIKNNVDKKYLLKIKDQGVSVIETYYAKSLKETKNIIDKINQDKIIIKPSISASGKNTHLLEKINLSSILLKAKRILKISNVIIQPFISSIQTIGEKSTILVDKDITFTMSKRPKKNGYLVHTHKGGSYKKSSVKDKDLPFINSVIKILPKKLAYARIDYLFDKKGNPMLLELEMIEPNLYLDENPLGLEKLTNLIERYLYS